MKLYFCESIDEERCYPIRYFIEEMKERGLSELILSKAVKDKSKDYFYCKAVDEVCGSNWSYEPCGKLCCDYMPRNGKSGICKHKGYCYVPTDDEYELTIDGKLKNIEI